MLDQPERLRIVEHGAPHVALCGEAGLAMAVAAERLGRMARAAIGFAAVRLRCVGRDEVGRMVAPRHALAGVAVGAIPLGMATRALCLLYTSPSPRDRQKYR